MLRCITLLAAILIPCFAGCARRSGPPPQAAPPVRSNAEPAGQEPAGQEPAGQDPPPAAAEPVLPDPRPETVAAPAEVRVLFDGTSLDDWKITAFGSNAPVTLVDGALELGFGNPLCGVTWAGGELPRSGYRIVLEAQRVRGVDFFCCLTFPVGDSHCSFVAGGWGGTVTGLSSIDGEDASTNVTRQLVTYEPERWYEIAITVTDDLITAAIDGEETVRQAIQDHTFSVRNEVRLSRPLGICSFETVARIRNVRLELLAPDSQESD